jgi:ribosomal protein L32
MVSTYISSGQKTKKQMKSLAALESRELYPRMGWHDIQCAISGRVARDIASHFVQRWNHHRLSTSNLSQPIMYDITDEVFFTVCAKCGKNGISEAITICPNCGYYLGPPNSYSVPMAITCTPIDPSRYSYLVFQNEFDLFTKLPFRMEGDCPVVVTMVLPNASETPIDGSQSKDDCLLDLEGPMAEWLHAVGLQPCVGDVILCMDGDIVTQLNSGQLRKLIVKKRRKAKSEGKTEAKVRVTFRRHYLEV